MEQSQLMHRSESGQTMAEYAVTLSVITIVVIAALTLLGAATATLVSRVISAM
jgi:Flp pilus assembly pilin Flp